MRPVTISSRACMALLQDILIKISDS